MERGLCCPVMKIDYDHAKGLCTANEFSLVEQCKPKTLTKFTVEELERKIQQSRKIQKESKGEKSKLFSGLAERLESRLWRRQKEANPHGDGERHSGRFPRTPEPVGKTRPLSLKAQAKQNGILSLRRIEASGLDSRVKGHVAARGRRKEAAREARNG